MREPPPIDPFPNAQAEEHFRMAAVRRAKGIARDQGEASRVEHDDLEDFYGVGAFPLDALPGPVRKIIAHYASKRGLPEHVIAAMALCVIGASVRHRVAVKSIDSDWCRPNLHVLFAAPSGVGKSQTIDDLALPILKAHQERKEKFLKEQWADLMVQLKNAEKTIRLFEGARAKAPVSEGEYKQALMDRERLKKRIRLSSCIHGNATEEGLFSEMAQDYGWAFSKTDEASGQISVLLGQYSGTVGGELYVQSYGSKFAVPRTRKGNENGREEIVPIMALLWCTQPDQIPRLGGNERLLQGGFVPRLITLCYTGALGTYAGRNGHFDLRQEENFAEVIATLESVYLHPDEEPLMREDSMEKTLFLDREEGVEQFWKDESDRIKLDGQLEASIAFPFLLRIVEQAIKIALILHLAEHAIEGQVPHLHPISMGTAKRALRLAEWFARSSADLYLRTEATGNLKNARKLVKLLRKAEGRFLVISDVTRHSTLSAGDVQSIVDAWKDHHVFSLAKVDTGKAGKPPKRVTLNVGDDVLLKLGLMYPPFKR